MVPQLAQTKALEPALVVKQMSNLTKVARRSFIRNIIKLLRRIDNRLNNKLVLPNPL